MTIGSMLEMMKDITGIYWENRWTPIIEMAVNIALDVICIKFWGVQGVLFATAASIGLITLPSDLSVLFKYYFRTSPVLYILKYLLFMCIATASALVSCKLCGFIEGTRIVGLIIRLSICLIVPNAVFTIAFFRTDNFKSLLGTIKQLLGKAA